jgi:hypothetical protein
MRAKRVFENIGFQRGQDPKKTLEVGLRWRVSLFDGGSQISQRIQFGNILDIQKEAAQDLDREYQRRKEGEWLYPDEKILPSNFWATFELKDEDREGWWNEETQYRIKLNYRKGSDNFDLIFK